jgi:hypothetical protein
VSAIELYFLLKIIGAGVALAALAIWAIWVAFLLWKANR